ncbi:MAG: aldehyde dehydrogenase family protein [Achromobacter sp.]|uniref:aldehyde dehydrogenase family protein n=1 Tax=Achromobacter sp. TaxID=134375 RepID=UPI0012C58370|nr:aldehyde dehydrogenase family protein [Achromobacter sp.]MPS79706.1 aldehyde dehydrogenase family protein [Achromobacter sp.]
MKVYSNIVNGMPVDSGEHFESINPATLEVLGLIPNSSCEHVDAAVQAAKLAQPAWAALPDEDRKSLIMKVADLFANDGEMLAEWITKEQGKPLGGVGPDQVPGARFEVYACEAWTRVPASLDVGPEVVFEDDTRRDEVHRRPYGVVAAIAPWNWPLMIAIWQIIPALRMGNTVVLKPSEYTSICTLEMVRLIADLLPPGVLNTVTGKGDVGAMLVEHVDVDKILFTGSTQTGIQIAQTSATRLVPTTLELGGNDAALVLPDADPKTIAPSLFWGAFLNSGQTCACVKRLYVPDSMHDQIVEELRKLAEALPMGDGMQSSTALGPLQNEMQYVKVKSLLADAKVSGAALIEGFQTSESKGYFIPITIATGLKEGSRLVDEEQFGPVLPVIRYSDLDDAIQRANSVRVGLGASVWTSDPEAARAVALRLDAGTVWINQHGAVHPMVPFGGIKSSGWGTEFGIDGLKSVSEIRVVSLRKAAN